MTAARIAIHLPHSRMPQHTTSSANAQPGASRSARRIAALHVPQESRQVDAVRVAPALVERLDPAHAVHAEAAVVAAQLAVRAEQPLRAPEVQPERARHALTARFVLIDVREAQLAAFTDCVAKRVEADRDCTRAL